jgi:rhamnopyranosyl-N-acetylglucosaminyl-diphospho-decaprenol beta-1,3/1,4-galactofuranosyltransferase
MRKNKNKKEKIAAVVVTYNRKKLLRECLDSLLKQTRPLDSIIIMDNASTDGTEEMLRKKYLKNPIFDYVNLGENTGGAGGFHYGIKRAYEKDFDWLWLMDDDVEPHKKCLENLLKYKNISFCIHPLKIFNDGEEQIWEGIFNKKTGQIKFFKKNKTFLKGKSFCYVNYGCFEGMLINRLIIKKIGLPDKNFFICYDDRLYGYLASRQTKVIFTNTAKMNKKIDKRNIEISDLSLYYSTRNLFLLDKHLNNKKINLNIYIFFLYLKKLIKLFLKGRFNSIKILFISFLDGVKFKFGKTNLFDKK